ncbi:MAG: hypothetical protein ABSG44_11150 [Thermodesulfobacteriota bacterium]|jgi:hypothetical protein
MTPFSFKGSSLENKSIGNILREYIQMAGIMERYFGGHCLKKRGFKLQTLGMACILFDVDKNRLIQDFEKVQSEDKDG